jgi:hypothetical protein
MFSKQDKFKGLPIGAILLLNTLLSLYTFEDPHLKIIGFRQNVHLLPPCKIASPYLHAR